jgi:hypothetical protein
MKKNQIKYVLIGLLVGVLVGCGVGAGSGGTVVTNNDEQFLLERELVQVELFVTQIENGRILGYGIGEFSDTFDFSYEHLADIGVDVGHVITVYAHPEWIEISPIPLEVNHWRHQYQRRTDLECIEIVGDGSNNFNDMLNNLPTFGFDDYLSRLIPGYASLYTTNPGWVVLYSGDLSAWETPEIFEGLTFSLCETQYGHTYRELADLRNDLSTVNTAYLTRVSGWGIDIKENVLVVHLSELTPEIIDAFRRDVVDSPLIRFEQRDFIHWDLEMD